jgi:mono/diheme cytochrome c family protein
MAGARQTLARRGWYRAAGACAALVPVLSPGGAWAQSTPPKAPTFAEQVSEGQKLAVRLCSTCHLVEGQTTGPTTAGIPSFRGMANRPDQTAERIRNVLIDPHPTMPDLQLSRPEIDRLTAYIDSLRAESAGPPLTSRSAPGAKPVYPDPS